VENEEQNLFLRHRESVSSSNNDEFSQAYFERKDESMTSTMMQRRP
jgi:hypothetical protein